MLHYRIIERLQAHSNTIKESLANDGAKDYAAYRWHVGQIQGIKNAISLIEQTIKDLKEDDHG